MVEIKASTLRSNFDVLNLEHFGSVQFRLSIDTFADSDYCSPTVSTIADESPAPISLTLMAATPSGGKMSAWTNKSHPPSRILIEILVGFATVLILLFGKAQLEQMRIGHFVEDSTYEYLISVRAWFDRGELPVVVVNIGQEPGGSGGQVTSRDTFISLVGALVDQDPAAIAIDEDFSSSVTGWADDDDPDFFKFCLETRKDTGIPILLGVYKGMKGSPDAWLGLPKYKEMAVSIVRRRGVTRRMPLWVQAIGVAEKLPSLGAALAKEYRNSVSEPRWLASVTNRTSDSEAGKQVRLRDLYGDEFDVAESLVNYGKLEQLQAVTLPTMNADFIKKSKEMFRGKMVIIGDATGRGDASQVSGQSEPVSGVFLHACAAYTWTRAPLYEFKDSFRWVVDLSLSSLIVVSVALMRFFNAKGYKRFSSRKWQGRLIWILFLGVIIAGSFLVVKWGIAWLDFSLAAFAFLLHPWMDHKLSRLWRKLVGRKRKPKQSMSSEGGQR